MLLGTVGLVVVGIGRDPALPLVAFALCLLAALSWAAGNVVTRAAAVPTGLGLTVWSAAVVPLPLLALSLVVDGPTEVVEALSGLTWRPLVATTYTVVLASLVGRLRDLQHAAVAQPVRGRGPVGAAGTGCGNDGGVGAARRQPDRC